MTSGAASRQKSTREKIRPITAICSRQRSPCAGSARSGTTKKMSDAATTLRAPSTMNSARQPNGPSSASTGAVADSVPRLPMPIIQPAQRGEALARKPQREGLDRAHEAGRNAQADQRAPDREHRQVARQAEDQRAGAGDAEQRRRAAPRSEAVERHAERQLREREGEEVRARQQAEVRGREVEVGHQVLRDHRVHVAVEVRKVVARREGAEHHKHRRSQVG